MVSFQLKNMNGAVSQLHFKPIFINFSYLKIQFEQMFFPVLLIIPEILLFEKKME